MTEFDNQKYSSKSVESFKGQGKTQESKFWAGVLLSMFLGIMGLIIGLLLYPVPYYDYERKTFLKGWLYTFVIIVGIIIVIAIITLIVLAFR